MHKLLLSLGLLPITAGCDHMMTSRLRLAPVMSTAPAPSEVQPDPQRTILAAIEQVSMSFGLQRDTTANAQCAGRWEVPGYTVLTAGGPRKALGFLSVCVQRQNGSLDVRVDEFLTFQWSAKADSLRRALADTLRHYGAVSTP